MSTSHTKFMALMKVSELMLDGEQTLPISTTRWLSPSPKTICRRWMSSLSFSKSGTRMKSPLTNLLVLLILALVASQEPSLTPRLKRSTTSSSKPINTHCLFVMISCQSKILVTKKRVKFRSFWPLVLLYNSTSSRPGSRREEIATARIMISRAELIPDMSSHLLLKKIESPSVSNPPRKRNHHSRNMKLMIKKTIESLSSPITKFFSM
mmetsp:Transcript_36759/g.32982  ORF Transcript_36759/g.32982 Transcript_36759/m.32982 type:complete len:209 (-) Transcript_36759:5134-5760(-)